MVERLLRHRGSSGVRLAGHEVDGERGEDLGEEGVERGGRFVGIERGVVAVAFLRWYGQRG